MNSSISENGEKRLKWRLTSGKVKLIADSPGSISRRLDDGSDVQKPIFNTLCWM